MPDTRFISPKDLTIPASVFSSQVFENVHQNQTSTWQLMGPKWYYEKWNLECMDTEELGISVDTYEPGGGSVPHNHPEWEQSFYIVSGQALVTVGDEQKQLHAGDAAWTPPGVEHTFVNNGEDELKILIISVMPKPQDAS